MVSTLGAVLVAAVGSGHASWVDVGTFTVAAAIILSGAVGVVVARNPVHSALMLVMTLFGVAVLFVLQRDPFLAAVQVIVYAGAIVVLFLFVIMFLGVDREEDIGIEPLRGQRPLAIGLIVLGTTGLLLLGEVSRWTTGAPHVAGIDAGKQSNVYLLGKAVYTTYLFPFEATAALLVIAVVGAVVLARRPPAAANPVDADGSIDPADAGVLPSGEAPADPVAEEGSDTDAGGPAATAPTTPSAPSADADADADATDPVGSPEEVRP